MIHSILLVFAFVFFVLAAIQPAVIGTRVNLIGAGLACWVASLLIH